MPKHFIFTYQGAQYAIPINYVLELVPVQELAPLHCSMSGCLGNFEYRHHLVPVFDPGRLSQTIPLEQAPQATKSIMVVEDEGALFGLFIEKFLKIATFKEAEEKASPAENEGKAIAHQPFIESVRAFRHRILITFSVPAIRDLVKKNFSDQKMLSDQEDESDAISEDALIEQDHQNFLCIRIEDLQFAIAVEEIIEIIEGYSVSPLFRVNSSLRGLINLRGRVIACFDVSEALDLPFRVLDENSCFVILQGEHAELALCVDEVSEIRRLPLSAIQNAKAVLSGKITNYVHGVVEEEGARIFTLSVSQVFAAEDLRPYLDEQFTHV